MTMRKDRLWMTVALIAPAALSGQTFPESGNVHTFQYRVAGAPPDARVATLAVAGNAVVAGRPFSATEERHSTQTLGDGTHIETSETNKLFRDEEGRTRTERKDGTVSIVDPVAGYSLELNPDDRTAVKIVSMRITRDIAPGATGAIRMIDGQPQLHSQPQKAPPNGEHSVITLQNSEIGYAPGMRTLTFSNNGPTVLRVEPGNNASVENLAPEMVNGVLSHGTRTTETIPVGKIGNDRVINIVNERWYSDALQMLIRSSSSDPRFGTTTYQLTNVAQTAPDPSLFQVPADYTIRK
jgi:hypothetical protein